VDEIIRGHSLYLQPVNVFDLSIFHHPTALHPLRADFRQYQLGFFGAQDLQGFYIQVIP